MSVSLNASASARLERSCGPSRGDWIRYAPSGRGLERIDAFFAGHAYDPHRHDTYAIGYTVGGVQSFDYRGSHVDSTRGNVIVLHPDETHDGRAGTETGFRYRMLYVEPRLIRDALDGRARTLPFVRTAAMTDSRLMAALQPALEDLERPLEELEADQVVLAVAEALLVLDPGAARGSSGRLGAASVERARQFLDRNFSRAVGSEELEALSGLDRYALARHFRAQFGTSPHRYLTMRRLDRTRALIRTGHSLADAALASGFADQSHMTRHFKRAYGLSPGRWRAMHAAALR